MRLNLSSNPFRNRALPWTVTAVIATASIVALVFIMRAAVQTNAQAQSVERDVNNLQRQTNDLKRRADEVKSALTPDQLRTLKSAHALADRKNFSWSRLFADLEAALPGSVRVSRISVKDVGTQGDRPIADLDLVVMSKNSSPVTEMISEMEREGIFHAELVSQNPQHGRGESGAEYELNVRYVPRAGAPAPVSERTGGRTDTAASESNKTSR